jgi:hypothetical protein
MDDVSTRNTPPALLTVPPFNEISVGRLAFRFLMRLTSSRESTIAERSKAL